MKKLETDKSLEIREIKEHINELLRILKEKGETVAITDNDEIIAHLVPITKAEPANTAGWDNLKRLSAELSVHWPADVSAVEAIRDVRREL
jgi:antitoxin (DNA-binding transcriptional repressor) of toxin-antitoxin stability system